MLIWDHTVRKKKPSDFPLGGLAKTCACQKKKGSKSERTPRRDLCIYPFWGGCSPIRSKEDSTDANKLWERNTGTIPNSQCKQLECSVRGGLIRNSVIIKNDVSGFLQKGGWGKGVLQKSYKWKCRGKIFCTKKHGVQILQAAWGKIGTEV